MLRIIRWTAVLAGVVGLLGASTAYAQNDSVVGVGATEIGSFTIDAASGASGEAPHGYVDFFWTSGFGTGLVQHLCVTGTQAVITGALDSGPMVGAGFVFFVGDRTTAGLPDLIQISILDQIPTACPAFAMSAPQSVTYGDIVVVDAPSSTPSDQLDAAVPCVGPIAGLAWKNHGQYMRTVAQAVDSMVTAGTITEDQGDTLVSGRAQNSCGQLRYCGADTDCTAGFVCQLNTCVPHPL
jgi:Cys-rich repeat protein